MFFLSTAFRINGLDKCLHRELRTSSHRKDALHFSYCIIETRDKQLNLC